MVAALKRGEIDAAEDVPGTAFHQLEKDPNIVTVQGNQGAMNEFAINGGAGLKKPHPALLDLRVRQAIAHAIDKKTIVNRVARRPRHAGRHAERLPQRRVVARDPGRPALRLRPRQGQADPRRRPATRTPTATASARCPAAGGR